MIQLSFDQDGVTLEFKSHQSLLDRLLSRHKDEDFDHDTQLSFALAELRATAEEIGEDVEIDSSRIRISYRTLSALSSESAESLGLPPFVELTLRTDVMGQIGSSDFQLTYDWLRAGRKEMVHRTGSILETSASEADGLRRLPLWMFDALEVADHFKSGSDLDEHWEALARFRRALEPGFRIDSEDEKSYLEMTNFLAGLEVALTDRFSISPQGTDQFSIIPFLGESVAAAEIGGEQMCEEMAELKGGKLQAFKDKSFAHGARPAYKLGEQSYLVVAPHAAPVLKVMTEMQQAEPDVRAEFIKNPRQKITEAVTRDLRLKGKLSGLSPAQEQEMIEQVAEPAFVETREYSERVIGLTVYKKSTIEINGSGTTWLPEEFTSTAIEKIKAMKLKEIERLLEQVNKAIESGKTEVTIEGTEIPATPTTRSALVQLIQDIRDSSETGDERSDPEGSNLQNGPIILDTADNIEDLSWTTSLRPRPLHTSETLPEVVTADLKKHQAESFRWHLEAWSAGLPGILNADEQGLGKTLQAIAFLAWIKDNQSRSGEVRTGPVLVVAPTSLLVNWEVEVDKHLSAPGLGNVVRLYGSAIKAKKQIGQTGIETDSGRELLDLRDLEEAINEGRGHRYWVLTTYTTLTNYQHSLAKIRFSTAIFDEIQALKNPLSLRSKAALAVNADFRIGLTGTPIENSTVDLWAIMEQLTPGLFGSLKSFRERFGEPEEENMRCLYSQMFEPQAGLPPVALRRLKEQVARELPEKLRKIHPRLMPEPQATAYEMARGLLTSGTPGSALKMLHHIRSVSVHPNASSPTQDGLYISMSARLLAAMDILRVVRDSGERALVFIEHIKMQHRFIELVKREFGLRRVDLINGSTSILHRQEIVNRFQRHLDRDEGFDLLVLGPKAAGTGLTLTAATHVIHLSRWWNPAVEEQCNDRVHRIGQNKPVRVHVPMAIHPGYQHNSFDCLLHSLMTRKRRLANSALWPMGDTDEDAKKLQEMLGYESETTSKDPLGAAMEMMFQQGNLPSTSRNADGSITYL